MTLESRYQFPIYVEIGRAGMKEDLVLGLQDGTVTTLDPGEFDTIFALAKKGWGFYIFRVHERVVTGRIIEDVKLMYEELQSMGWHVVLGP